ncbi:MAG: porin family protein [Prevotellaceae bacterium]|jgi:hypothetical protein|nr:porin family protein [Prevotellaceae bacterium]
MKKVVFILVLILFAGTISLVNAQDIITKKDGTEISAKVTEVNATDIKYKMYGEESGPIYTLPKSQIFMIVYQGGIKEMFNTPETPVQTPQTPPQGPITVVGGVSQPNGYVPQSNVPSAYKKGYVGISFGPSFLTKQENIDAGVQVSIVNFGYLFNSHVGITSSIITTSYDISNISVGISGFMAGPLFSFAATPSQKVEFDIRPAIGYARGAVDGESTDETGFALGLGGSVRWNCWNRVSFSGNLDYYNMTIKNDTYKTNMSSVGVTIGVNFRF